jgi:Carboxypeptidase regulatory-like domain
MSPLSKVEMATELGTKTESRTLSDASGKYTIPFLAPGLYQIDAEAPGFEGFQRQKFALNASERPVLDIHLEVGELQQTVAVMTANSRYLHMPAILFSGTTFNPLNTRASIVYDNPGDSFQVFAT